MSITNDERDERYVWDDDNALQVAEIGTGETFDLAAHLESLKNEPPEDTTDA